ncbi:ParA family protein [Halanaeroarchaeum sulfurireducens]|uniref:Cell division inhibitor n=1 Tax=Halanaeroarchaeum sulfurireducens TaxID=1604004 RepID=A0A0F7PBF2_9EURY|nr:AAA family ATPase [Halanaeroarchaeum sulfurireducens]AKH96653.1 cell division inhibitor [Halanaeroarchaeum sulfurireducens]ALG81055.1 cell division inhibitor [Halanaeroarchaeum sulfurireducens]
MHVRTAALVGVTGGAGTTRTAVELAGALARAGRSVLVFDLNFATQGLSQSVGGRIDPDVTSVLTDEEIAVTDATIPWAVPGEGRLSVLPAFAPFVDVAEAKTVAAAERVGDRLREATDSFDHVLLDVPPIASNQAVAGVDAADRVAAVLPATDRGVDALQRTRGRLDDVGADLDVTIATRTTPSAAPGDADATIPTLPAKPAPDRPVTVDGSGDAVAAVVETAARLFEIELAVASDHGGDTVMKRMRRRLG